MKEPFRVRRLEGLHTFSGCREVTYGVLPGLSDFAVTYKTEETSVSLKEFNMLKMYMIITVLSLFYYRITKMMTWCS